MASLTIKMSFERSLAVWPRELCHAELRGYNGIKGDLGGTIQYGPLVFLM